MSGVLEGVRVLDLAGLAAGQYATRIMADLGADVVKLEPAPAGDPLRQKSVRDDARLGHLFDLLSAGKRSLCLDVTEEAASALVLDLAARSDVIVESYL